MPDTEKRQSAQGPEINIPKPTAASDGALRDESDLYGDEAEIPSRRKKKAESTGKRKIESKPSNHSAAAVRAGFIQPEPKKKRSPAIKQRRPRRSFYELMSASGSEGFFKPIRLLGREFRFWPLVLLIAIVILISGVILNNSNLVVTEQRVTVVGLPQELEGYRIIVLSDMNARRFGDTQSLLIRTLNSVKYDAIFCLGDMVGKSGNAQPFWEFLEGLRSPEKVYFICGDRDPGPYVRPARGTEGILSQLVLEDWILGAIERGAHYVDAPTLIQVHNARLWVSPATMMNLETVSTLQSWQEQTEQETDGVISGINEDYTNLPITSYRMKIAQALYDAQRSMSASDIHIALAHEVPTEDFIYTSQEHNPDVDRFLSAPELVLAGHYCGGVWRLPFFGAFFVPDKTLPRSGWFPKQSQVSGLTSIGETQVYITRGMATNGSVPLMPFRLFNSPEVSVLVLTSTLPENMLEAAG